MIIARKDILKVIQKNRMYMITVLPDISSSILDNVYMISSVSLAGFVMKESCI